MPQRCQAWPSLRRLLLSRLIFLWVFRYERHPLFSSIFNFTPGPCDVWQDLRPRCDSHSDSGRRKVRHGHRPTGFLFFPGTVRRCVHNSSGNAGVLHDQSGGKRVECNIRIEDARDRRDSCTDRAGRAELRAWRGLPKSGPDCKPIRTGRLSSNRNQCSEREPHADYPYSSPTGRRLCKLDH
jgi:hypothetical protein